MTYSKEEAWDRYQKEYLERKQRVKKAFASGKPITFSSRNSKITPTRVEKS